MQLKPGHSSVELRKLQEAFSTFKIILVFNKGVLASLTHVAVQF